jgi:hypothetical protein
MYINICVIYLCKVSTYIQSCEKATVSKGLVVQAFSFSLQEELHDYYRLLAVLEQELARKTVENDDGYEYIYIYIYIYAYLYIRVYMHICVYIYYRLLAVLE